MLRYLKIPKVKAIFHRPSSFSVVSDYFGPEKNRPVEYPKIDGQNNYKIYSEEKRVRELLHDNEIIRNPHKHMQKKIAERKKLMGKNYSKYLEANFVEEVKGIRHKTGIIVKNLTNQNHPNNYRFRYDIDYFIDNENERILKQIHSLDYLEKKNPINFIKHEFMPRNDYDHESLHRKEYPKATNYVAQLKANQIIVQNLPLDTHIYDLIELFEKYGKVKDVRLVACLMNLPAFAIVEFEKSESIFGVLNEVHWKMWKNSLLCIKTREDAQYEESWNRTLCILNIPPEMPEIVIFYSFFLFTL